MAKSKKQLHETLRQRFLTLVNEYLINEGEEILRIKSNEIAIPTLDEEGNEEFVVITFKVPVGSRDDGEAYDGYSLSQIYVEQCLKREEDRRLNEERKAKKIARDRAMREAKAKARAEHQAKVEG